MNTLSVPAQKVITGVCDQVACSAPLSPSAIYPLIPNNPRGWAWGGWRRAVGSGGWGVLGTHLVLAHPPHQPPLFSPIHDLPLPNALGVLGPSLQPCLLMFVMISLTEIQDNPLGADVRNLQAGDLNWRNTDIWHWVQPTKLSGSWEGESRERKGNFWSHHLRMEETGRLWAASSTSANGHSLLEGWDFHLLAVCPSLLKQKDV